MLQGRFQFKKTILYWIAIVYLSAVSLYAFVYRLSSYETVKENYRKLGNCYSLQPDWEQNHFTTQAKETGNILALGTAVAAVLLISYCIHKIRKKENETIILQLPQHTNRWIHIVLLLITAVVWNYGNNITPPTHDEVYSYINFSGEHPFVTLANYQAVNNHILFNLTNSLVFRWITEKVITARILSLIAYMAVVQLVYFSVRKYINSNLISAMAALTIAVMFPVWGFSFQGRGYEMLLLAEYVALLSILNYVSTKDNKWLLINSAAGAVAFATIPTYLYLFVAQQLFVLLYLHKVAFTNYIKYQTITGILTAAFYLPALSLYGIKAFTENRYVKADEGSVWEYIVKATPEYGSYIDYGFTAIASPIPYLNALLFVMPLGMMLYVKKSEKLQIAVQYAAIVAGTLVVIWSMKRAPYHRNLIGHYVWVMSMGIITLYTILSTLSDKLKNILTGTLLVLLMLYFAVHSHRYVHTVLYYSDTKANYHLVSDELNQYTPSTLSASPQAFYWGYVAGEKGYTISTCGLTDEKYFIKTRDEKYPDEQLRNYKLIKQLDIYELYEKY